MATEVYKATITLEVMGTAQSERAFKAEIEGMSLEDILEETDSGSMIAGTKTVTEIKHVNRDELSDELQAIGNDGSFFDDELED